MIELYILLIVAIGAGIVAVEIKDLLASAISLGVVGFSVAIMFILTQAPDLAIVQIVVEVLTVVIFVGVILKTTHIDTTLEDRRDVRDYLTKGVFVLFGIFFLLFSISALKEIPHFGQPIMKIASHYLVKGFEEIRAANQVAAIILDFRGYDTLGEATVLFTSVIGVLTILRKIGKIK
ncbi:MAG: hydrogen gas-evolving membrane-bound hydrogenase subunit E [candidate division WOR-3 bacterium]